MEVDLNYNNCLLISERKFLLIKFPLIKKIFANIYVYT